MGGCFSSEKVFAFQSDHSFYSLSESHWDLKATTDFCKFLKTQKRQNISHVFEYFQKFRSSVTIITDSPLIFFLIGKSRKEITLDCLSFILFRLSQFQNVHEGYCKENTPDIMIMSWMLRIMTLLEKENDQNETKYYAALSFLFNYSRALIDPQAQHLSRFFDISNDFLKNLYDPTTIFDKAEKFDYVQTKTQFIKDAISLFKNCLNSNWAKSAIEKWLASLHLLADIEELCLHLKSVPIYISSKSIGVTGFISFGFIGLSPEEIKKGCSKINNNSFIIRAFIAIWHEVGHYLMRYLTNNFFSQTPRGDENQVCKYEAGYKLEFCLFQSCEILFWDEQEFQGIVLSEQWGELSLINPNLPKFNEFKRRDCHMTSSGMEFGNKPSWIE